MTDARAVIESLRDGCATPEGVAWFAAGLASGQVSDAQAGAFAMAALLRGLSEETRVALTLAMRDSGNVLAWDLPGPVIDKHSTGGVGDSISLLLAPVLAECGGYVPMVSGRGLGHTGGTLDKLESIPGFLTDTSEDRLRALMSEVGCAIVSASARIAPADKRLYAVRDVTGTVSSVDLITASILSKKLAAGLDALVLDVKTGSGAFLPSAEQAQALAKSLVETANGAGCKTSALITDMDRPLALCAGNALEVAEVMDTLTGTAPTARLIDLTAALCGEVLALSGLADNAEAGATKARETLTSGAAAARFERMVAAQGGPKDFSRSYAQHLPTAPVIRDVPAPHSGILTRYDTRALGEAVVHLGGGRLKGGDIIDPRVGFSHIAAPGTELGPDTPIARVHAADEASADTAIAALQAACQIGPAPSPLPLVQHRIGP
ncbi:thymidine phosphorylase [Pararhodobacter oceanensis]|uniref:Thymidine phosphorylase n=1 Tax=Pararhodobacter oceanensis TaxID=2172121 RepID=A0A2T8HUC9_9RHOB|nr:thymidine phosphorylase [Pararhodobacter oceanensis]PVH29067.1 thymidine phosphorylase [Pararhodobacter oceanensis]